MIAAAPDARLPDGFVVRLNTTVRRRPDGALLGGSPLRLMRLSVRARDLLAGDRFLVRDATTAELAARLLDAGLASPDLPPRPAADVTVVVPVRDRPEGLTRLLGALRDDPATAGLPVVIVDDGSVVPVSAAGATVRRHEVSRGPAAARNTGLRAATTPFVVFLDSDCVPEAHWLERLRPHLDDPVVAAVAPRIVALAGADRRWLTDYESAVSALDMGAEPASVRPLSAVSYLPSAALLARREALGDGFDETMQVAEDVDLIWRLAHAGWRVRYDPAAQVAHDHPTRTADWLRRRAFYGTGAALLAARHGSAVAPVVLAPESALAWALAIGGGRRGRAAAAGVLALTSVRLARRLARPGTRPPLGFAAALVLRGQAAAGRTLARAVTRHHWPVAVAAAVVSRGARRGVLAVAAADALVAWWPRRHRVGPVRFGLARRLEDLAYGAGLWWGALRARDLRALLPARAPRL
jgi:mycofactocin system glycosyltransferase